MRKIVPHGHATDFTAIFHTPRDTRVSIQRFDRDLGRHARMARRGDRSERIHDVVHAHLVPVDHAAIHCVQHNVKLALLFAAPEIPLRARPKFFNRGPTALRQRTLQVLVASIGHNQAVAGQGANEMVKLRFDRLDIRENIGMVVFEIVQRQRARVVVNELAALVEKRSVVFVGLDDEEGRIAFGCTRRDAEIFRYATDQKTGCDAGVIENPGQHCRGRRFAVCAGNGQYPLAAQHVFAEPLRAGRIGVAAI